MPVVMQPWLRTGFCVLVGTLLADVAVAIAQALALPAPEPAPAATTAWLVAGGYAFATTFGACLGARLAGAAKRVPVHSAVAGGILYGAMTLLAGQWVDDVPAIVPTVVADALAIIWVLLLPCATGYALTRGFGRLRLR